VILTSGNELKIEPEILIPALPYPSEPDENARGFAIIDRNVGIGHVIAYAAKILKDASK